jgi:hypothetical protein
VLLLSMYVYIYLVYKPANREEVQRDFGKSLSLLLLFLFLFLLNLRIRLAHHLVISLCLYISISVSHICLAIGRYVFRLAAGSFSGETVSHCQPKFRGNYTV